jgi:epoxyqueuosine reductase QueG
VKEAIREFVLGLGADDVGFAAVKDYISPLSPPISTVMPKAKALIITAFQEIDNCESENMQIACGGRLDLLEFARSSNYKLARFLQKNFRAKAVSIPLSYPLEMSMRTKGAIADVSLRHAAVAAGLGQFGLHNLVVHPHLGSHVIFAGVITDLDLSSDQAAENKCTECNLCVESCPGSALSDSGKTHLMKCIQHSQPYGIGGTIRFWMKFIDSQPDEQKKMVTDEHFWRLYQAGFIGFQYFCFNCIKSCPIGRE